MENMPMPVPICSLTDAISAPIRTILCSVRKTDRIDVNHVKRQKNLYIMAAATLYSGLLMG